MQTWSLALRLNASFFVVARLHDGPCLRLLRVNNLALWPEPVKRTPLFLPPLPTAPCMLFAPKVNSVLLLPPGGSPPKSALNLYTTRPSRSAHAHGSTTQRITNPSGPLGWWWVVVVGWPGWPHAVALLTSKLKLTPSPSVPLPCPPSPLPSPPTPPSSSLHHSQTSKLARRQQPLRSLSNRSYSLSLYSLILSQQGRKGGPLSPPFSPLHTFDNPFLSFVLGPFVLQQVAPSSLPTSTFFEGLKPNKRARVPAHRPTLDKPSTP